MYRKGLYRMLRIKNTLYNIEKDISCLYFSCQYAKYNTDNRQFFLAKVCSIFAFHVSHCPVILLSIPLMQGRFNIRRELCYFLQLYIS